MMDGVGEEGRNCLHKSMSNRWGRENEEIKTVRGSDLPVVKAVQIHLIFWRKIGNLKGFPGGSLGKESACNAGDPSSIPGLGRSPEERKGCPLQYSGLEIPWTV